MGKVIKYIALALLFSTAAFGINYLVTYAKIGAGYNAKLACSCHFISGRTLEDITENDLYAVPFAKQSLDEANKIVHSSIFGIIERSAKYTPGLGCTLLDGNSTAKNDDLGPVDVHTSKSELPDSLLPPERNVAFSGLLDKYITENTGSRALLVVKDGRIVGEKYAPGFNKETPLLGWSMTKSVTNTMVGVLVRDGILNVDDDHLFEEWKNDERSKIKLDDLMRMVSGLEFEENYEKVADATRMLFLEDAAGRFALNKPLTSPPGTYFYYSSGTTNILQELIKSTFTDTKHYLEFPHRRIFSKLGMSTVQMEPDANGTYVGSSFMYASARDWAKLGLLYINDGMYQGQQILPPGWVKYSSTPTQASNGEYAAQFWIDIRKHGLPQDAILMNGHDGQFVLIIPSQNLVIVRLGWTSPGKQFDQIAYFNEVSKFFN